jgi:cytochrome c553
MYDMQQGTRKGLWKGLMKPLVAHLSEEELMNLAAYVASRTPCAADGPDRNAIRRLFSTSAGSCILCR